MCVPLSFTHSLSRSLRSHRLHRQSPLSHTHRHTQDYLSACLLTVSSPSPLARPLDQYRLGSAPFDPEPVVVVIVAFTAGIVCQMNGPKVNFPKGRSLQVCNSQGHLRWKWCHSLPVSWREGITPSLLIPSPNQPTHPPHWPGHTVGSAF